MIDKDYWDLIADSCVAGGQVGGDSNRRTTVNADLLNQGWTGKILEVGCGTGINLQLYPNMFGCDLSPNMVALATTINSNVVTLSTNLLPYPDGDFNVVFTVTCLQHVLVDIQTLCNEILRVGSKIVIYEDLGSIIQYPYYIARSQQDYEQLFGKPVTNIRQVDGDLHCLEF